MADEEHLTRIRDQLVASERVEVDGGLIRDLHRRLAAVVRDRSVRKGERSRTTLLRTEAEAWDVIEEVVCVLAEGVQVMDEAIERAVAIVAARGPCGNPDCMVCQPPDTPDTPKSH